jgi:hypothetical protein
MPKNNNWVKWRNHPAREVILQDLNYGGWLYDELKDEDLDLAALFVLYNPTSILRSSMRLTTPNSKKGWRTTLKRTMKEVIDRRESICVDVAWQATEPLAAEESSRRAGF